MSWRNLAARARRRITGSAPLRGVLDGVNGDFITGWTFRQGAGSLSVALYHGEDRLLETVANLPRKDLEEAFGVLQCGFSFALPLVLSAMQTSAGETPASLRAVVNGVELAGALPPCTTADAADAAALTWLRHLRTLSPAPVLADV